MSQDIFSTIDPSISGTDLATALNSFKDAIVSGFSGTSRPAELGLGGAWIDTTNEATPNFYWSYKIWTGTSDVEVFRLHLDTSVASVALAVEEFSVKKITADTVGAILKLVKQRIATNGQVLSGDTIGEIRFVGRTSTSTNPVVAYMKWDATDDQTTSAYGGTFGFYSTPDGTAAATLHMRFINGLVETVVPHKLNSLRLVSQDVATTATIAQMSGAKVLVEMTGSTATSIQGINSAHDSQVVTVHNRSSAIVTLKHQDSSATAVDRMKLPNSADYAIAVDATATLYYCTTDSRWKLLSTADRNFTGNAVETFYGVTNTFTAPVGVSYARVRSYKRMPAITTSVSGFLDPWGNAYTWGLNSTGQLGVGDVTPRSSPVAVLGGLTFTKLFGNNAGPSYYGVNSDNGFVYAWGGNANSQLGVAADVVPRSSPVAVLGSLRALTMYTKDTSAWLIATNNAAYAWGINTNGQLGVGNVTLQSSPVLVLGGLRWASLVPTSGASNSSSVVGLTTAGVAYAWGINTNGQLGLGDVTVRSSPVAVLGGLTFASVVGGAVSSRYFYLGLTTAGVAYGWGNNANGQLGNSDVIARSSPVAVVGGLTFKELIYNSKSESVFGLTSAGVLYAWGDNTQGVLGVGDTTARSSPVAVLGGLTFAKVRMYKSAVVGLTSDGTAYAWGINANGQLGVGDVVARSSPVAVLGGLKFVDIAFADGGTDQYSVTGVTPDGTMYAWGVNSNGTLGVGDVTPRSSPVAVLGGFRADVNEPSYSTDLTVVPSTAYTITIHNGIASFGNTPLGLGVYKVEVEYLQ